MSITAIAHHIQGMFQMVSSVSEVETLIACSCACKLRFEKTASRYKILCFISSFLIKYIKSIPEGLLKNKSGV